MYVFEASLPLLGIFIKRLKVFYQDRKRTKTEFDSFLKSNQKPVIWIHIASLGEYEQVVPVVEQLKVHFNNHAFLFSFFSDSGYRVKKNKSIGDFETYLPLDTTKNAKAFVEKVQPKLAVFVKYDIWPNFLYWLKINSIKSFLVASRFRSGQIYFQFYGSFFKKALQTFYSIFVQDKSSGQLLSTVGINNWIISGDTRFDRVSLQLEQNNKLDFMEDFLQDSTCMVCGSTWAEGEKNLFPAINNQNINLKYVIAPHQISDKHIAEIESQIKKPCVKYSDIKDQKLSDYQVLILDTIGLLTKVYAYADLAYVGGGFGTAGLHNILEPAAFGVPILIGPNHYKFPEAKTLENQGGLLVVNSAEEMQSHIKSVVENADIKEKMSQASKTFILMQKGATDITVKGIIENLST